MVYQRGTVGCWRRPRDLPRQVWYRHIEALAIEATDGTSLIRDGRYANLAGRRFYHLIAATEHDAVSLPVALKSGSAQAHHAAATRSDPKISIRTGHHFVDFAIRQAVLE